jgi:hypothetical protein
MERVPEPDSELVALDNVDTIELVEVVVLANQDKDVVLECANVTMIVATATVD